MADVSRAGLHLEVLASGPQRHISEKKRFALLVVGSMGMVCSSFSYAFNLVMPVLQTRYNFSQRETASITTVGLVFGYCMLPFGALYDYLGPLPVSLLSMVMYPLGGILTALCFEGVIEGSTVRLAVFYAMQCLGLSLSDLVCCMTMLSYFPSNRGLVIALLKTFLGLGSAIVSTFSPGFFNSNMSHYLFFLAVISFVMNTICALVMRLPEYHMTGYQLSHLSEEEKGRRGATKAQYLKQRPPMWRFVYGFVILVILIIYLPTESALVAYLGLGHAYTLPFAIVTAVVTCLYLFVAVPLPACLTRRIACCKHENMSDDESAADDEEPPMRHVSPSSDNEPCRVEGDAAAEKGTVILGGDLSERDAGQPPSHAPVETDVDYLAPQYQGTFFQNLCSLELWALWWTLFCVVGTEYVIIYNATFILGALQGSKPSQSLTTLLTVLNGVGSAVGRLLMSYFEVWSQKRKAEDRVPITIALFFPTSTIIITLVLFLTLPAVALPLPYVLAAFGNGFCAASQILVTRTIFAKNSALHYHFCFSSTMVAVVVFNRFLYAEWYTVQAEKLGRSDNLCYGKKCVLMPLVVMLGLAVSAFITDVVLHLRYRSYSLLVLKERARLCGEAKSLGEEEEVSMTATLEDGLDSREGQRSGDRQP